MHVSLCGTGDGAIGSIVAYRAREFAQTRFDPDRSAVV